MSQERAIARVEFGGCIHVEMGEDGLASASSTTTRTT